ncbi:hypothetical protein [Hungatella sp.]
MQFWTEVKIKRASTHFWKNGKIKGGYGRNTGRQAGLLPFYMRSNELHIMGFYAKIGTNGQKEMSLWQAGTTPAGGVTEDERADNSQGMCESALLRLV